MKNVPINKFSFLYLLVLSCVNNNNKEVTNENPKFKNFYEKIDSITINENLVYIEKFYIKNNLEYVVNYNNKKIFVPYSFDDCQATGFYIEKTSNKEFIITFGQGNATLMDYYFNIDINKNLILSKIKSTYNYKFNDSIIQDSIMINNKISSLNKNNLKQITNFINMN